MAIDKASKAAPRALGPSTISPSHAAPEAKTPAVKQQRAAKALPGTEPEVVRRRLQMGRDALKGVESPTVDLREAPKYFRTYEQVKDALLKIKEKNPELAELIDIGDSFEKVNGKADRDLLVLRLTSKKQAGPKPRVFFFGGQHAREIANPELMMRFIDWLVTGYGKDPDATALLDTRELDILAIMNPDGHAVIERGYSGAPDGDLGKRKNTSGKNGAGTDLNRNWATKNWGTAGVSHSPSSDTYCGPSAASEYEVKAMQAFIEQSKPSLMIDWHSYSELVLYPPDDDRRNKTPDHEHFVRVGAKFASFNGYTPQAAVDLYPTSGTSMWAYEKLAIPSFVVETGTAFHQSDAQFEETWKKNFPVMVYATSIADDWKKKSAGPDVARARIDENGTLTATAVDRLTQKPAKAIEVVLDPKAPVGEGTLVAPNSKGKFVAAGFVATRELAPRGERKLAYVRAMDDAGNWGPLKPLWMAAPSTSLRATALRATQAARKSA